MRIEPTVAGITAWLDAATNRERTGDFHGLRLDSVRAVLARLPRPPAPCTIAGTKGKGSTQRYLEAILLAHGESTLAFTSPHVTSVLERWRIDSQPATAVEVARAAEEVAAAEAASGSILSWFERTLGVAVVLAASRSGRCLLLEVGIGGRLDATNALDPVLAVVTALSHDHREVLGPTLEHIAREKLGISRPGRSLLIAPQSLPAAIAIDRMLPAGIEARWVQRPARALRLGMLGEHQQDNAATALAAARLLLPSFDAQVAEAALAEARLDARCQLIKLISRGGDRRILIDGAHNGASIAATIAVAQSQLRPGWTLVLGMARDKEIDEILAAIPANIRAVRCGYAGPRSRRDDDWPEGARPWRWHADVAAALAALPDGDLCITGSFYLAGEAVAALAESAKNLIPA